MAFDEVHLPAEQYSANIRALTPAGEATFSNTTVTETSVGGTSTKLTVTLSQTYVDAEHWSVSQSWSKEYTTHESTGEKSGTWSESTRKGLTTFSITVSLGFGVPDRPSVGKKKAATSDASHSPESSAVPDPGGSGLAPASSTPTPPPVVPVGPVSTISFSTSDSLNNSVGDTHDGSDTTTGKVDKGNFAGSSNASASKSAALTEFDVLRPDGTLGHTIQLTAADDRSAGMKFKGGNKAFDAAGDVKDGDGNTTNGTTHPFGTPFNSPGSKPPTDGDGFGNGTDPAPPMGGNGSRIESGAALNVSSSFSMGSYFSGEATTSVGADLEEANITGTAGMHTDYDGSIGASDSLSVDLQDSDATTGDFDYLSVGWTEGGSASRGLHFDYDMSLGDADLPTPTSSSSSSNSNPYPTDPSATSQVSSSGGSFGSASSSGNAPTSNSTSTDSSAVAPTNSASSFGASTPGALSGSGTSGGSGSGGSAPNTPTPGKPLIKLETLSNSGNGSNVWVQERTNKSTGGPLPTTDTYTEKSALSVRIGGGAEMSASMKLVNWVPTVTVTAKGGLNVTFLEAFVDGHEWGLSHASPPSGYQYAIYQHQDMDQTSTMSHAVVDFDVSVTLSPVADPKITGTVTIDVGSELKGVVGHYLHEKLVNLSNPSDIYEEWWLRQSVHREVLTAKGGVGGLANNLHIESFEQTYPIDVHTQNGTPPPPPPPQPNVFTTSLDYLQTGLDVAGMVPVLGEACDALNAGISLGRGNYGDAAMSLAAMIPIAGAGVTAGKFGKKIYKALAHNADKLDEVASVGKSMVHQVDDAAQQALRNCFPAGTPVATEFGSKPIETVRSGERVWSYDVVTSQWKLCHVMETFERHYDGHSVLVSVADETVEATLLHPFWVVSGESLADRPVRQHLARVPANATTPGRWVDAGDLQVGDRVLLRNGERFPIQAVNIQPYHDKVYNFEVADLHNYAVGGWEILVHNDNGLEAFEQASKRTDEIIRTVREQGAIKIPTARGPGKTLAEQVAEKQIRDDFLAGQDFLDDFYPW